MPVVDAPALMFYDGLCGFCNASVQWLLRQDKRDKFRFAAQQSAFAQEVLRKYGIDQEKMLSDNSVYLVMDLGSSAERLLKRSDVTAQCLYSLGGIWKALGAGLRVVPRFIRDAGYRAIAKNRFRLAGRYASCPIPTAAQRAKFLGV